MTDDPWRIVSLDQMHDRTAFDCGTDDLNRYLQEQAGQNSHRNISRTYVAVVASDPTRIGGYYTLTLRSIGFQELPKKSGSRVTRFR